MLVFPNTVYVNFIPFSASQVFRGWLLGRLCLHPYLSTCPASDNNDSRSMYVCMTFNKLVLCVLPLRAFDHSNTSSLIFPSLGFLCHVKTNCLSTNPSVQLFHFHLFIYVLFYLFIFNGTSRKSNPLYSP